MTDTTSAVSARSSWASLLRLPNVFTVLADVSAAFLLVAGPPSEASVGIRFLLIVVAGVLLYWAGMILNDVFDVEKDRIERPHRPLPSGQIAVSTAKTVAIGCMAGGVMLAAASGFVPSDKLTDTPVPGVIATVLAVTIYLYDGPFKRMAIAAYLMGACRFLSFLLGASPVACGQEWLEPTILGFPKIVVAAAIGFGLYITGLTLIGRKEATPVNQMGGGTATTSSGVNVGTTLTIIGVFVLAFSPRVGLIDIVPQIDPYGMFPLAIGLIAFPIVQRAIKAAIDPVPDKLQVTVKSGILNLIPLAACFAVMGAGLWGIGVFALVVPAFWLSLRYRVT